MLIPKRSETRERLFHWQYRKARKRLTSTRRIEKDSLIDPIATCCGDEDGREECVGASIISCGDASPVLDPAEHVLDAVSLLVERFVVFGGMLALFARRDARGSLCLSGRCGTSRHRSRVSQQLPGFWQMVEQVACTLIIADLACGQEEQQRPPQPVGDSMQLGVQAAFGSSDTAGKSPFFSRLAAVRWAFKWVASIISLSG